MTGAAHDPALHAKIIALQRAEVTERDIYLRIAAAMRDRNNREVLLRIAEEEYAHYRVWKNHTGTDVPPDRIRVLFFSLLACMFGITFAIKLMEGIEQRAQRMDSAVLAAIPDAAVIAANEKHHEEEIIGLLDEERLRYMGSVVLGLNDALVEFTGTLAGLSFALPNTRLIAITGLIMGAAASLSMGASEYLSQKSDGGEKSPFKASLYTGATYVLTVVLLILPFLVFDSPALALPITLASAIGVILCFTFYLSVARSLPFWRRFAEMAVISMGVAGLSFLIGIAIRTVLHIDM
jgi:VIT1/CCC1 family predicted Fe2+/Mn2+ transporter